MTATTQHLPAGSGTQLAALVLRGLRGTRRVPQLLMLSLTMPLAMLLLFSQVFRSVADNPTFPTGVSYIDFLTPAMLAGDQILDGGMGRHRHGPHERSERPLRGHAHAAMDPRCSSHAQ